MAATEVFGHARLAVRSSEEALKTVSVLGFVDAVVLVLTLLLLVAAPFESSHASEGCGWTPERFSTCALGAAACSLASLVVSAAQAAVLCGGPQARRDRVARRLGAHIIVPLLGLVAGGVLATSAMWGFAVIQRHAHCDTAAVTISPCVLAAGYGLAACYLLQALLDHWGSRGKAEVCDASFTDKDRDRDAYAAAGQDRKSEGNQLGQRFTGSSSSRFTGSSSSDVVVKDAPLRLADDCEGSGQTWATKITPVLPGSPKGSQKSSPKGSLKQPISFVLPFDDVSPSSASIRESRESSDKSRKSSLLSTDTRGTPAVLSRCQLDACNEEGEATIEKDENPSPLGSAWGEKRTHRKNSKQQLQQQKIHVTAAVSPYVNEQESAISDKFEQAFAKRRTGMLTAEDGSQPASTASRTSSRTDLSMHGREEPTSPTSAAALDGSSKSRLSASETFLRGLEEMPVYHLHDNPINFQRLKQKEDDNQHSDDSASSNEEKSVERHNTKDGDIDSDDDEWNCWGNCSVEVPIWLMDRLKASGTFSPNGDGGGDDLVDIREEEENEKADEEAENDGTTAHAQRSSQQSQQPTGNFWKIPIPTRKNSTLTNGNSTKTRPGSRTLSVDEVSSCSTAQKPPISTTARSRRATIAISAENNSARSRRSSSASAMGSNSATGPLSRSATGPLSRRQSAAVGASEPNSPLLMRRKSSRRVTLANLSSSRRPSVLGVFSQSQGNAQQEGLYAVQKPEQKQEEKTVGELVEVRRGSLVLSTTMMEEILKAKSENAKINRGASRDFPDQSEDFEAPDVPEEAEEDAAFFDDEDDEIILPLCTPTIIKNQISRKCQCRVHPVTGVVVHTCMTPSHTTDNTLAEASYICTEWSSRRGTINSRRGSEVTQTKTEDVLKVPVKRIRNASMLARTCKSMNSEREQEAAEENELKVSYSTLKSSRINSCRASVKLSEDDSGALVDQLLPIARLADSAVSEKQVEAELGHRFDLIEPPALSAKMHDPEILIVDVRGRDWVGGHIPYSINLSTSEVLSSPETLLAQCRRDRIHTVVFTCMYSVLRARKCAVALDMAQHEEQKAGHSCYRIKTLLLGGGMHAYVNHFMGPCSRDKDAKMKLADFAPSMWTDGGPSQGGLVHVMDAMWSSGGQKALSDALTMELTSLATHMSRRSTDACQDSSPTATDDVDSLL